MCQAKAQGGQRCFGHALTRFQKASEAAQVDPSEKNITRLTIAANEYASTPRGADDLRNQRDTALAQGRAADAANLDRYIDQGSLIRERNAAVKAAFKPRTATLMPTAATATPAPALASALAPALAAPASPAAPARTGLPLTRPTFAASTAPGTAGFDMNSRRHETYADQMLRLKDAADERDFLERQARWNSPTTPTPPRTATTIRRVTPLADLTTQPLVRDIRAGRPIDDSQTVNLSNRLTGSPDTSTDYLRHMVKGTTPTDPDAAHHYARYHAAMTAALPEPHIRRAYIAAHAANVISGRNTSQDLIPIEDARKTVAQITALRTAIDPRPARVRNAISLALLSFQNAGHDKDKRVRLTRGMVRDLSGVDLSERFVRRADTTTRVMWGITNTALDLMARWPRRNGR